MNRATHELEWLCDWFASQCNGDWEHGFGITIGTLDNPGWSFRVDLTDTPLADRPFSPDEIEAGDRWLRLWKEDEPPVFHAAGSPTALPEIIERFRKWATA
jgi:Immunity protein 53